MIRQDLVCQGVVLAAGVDVSSFRLAFVHLSNVPTAWTPIEIVTPVQVVNSLSRGLVVYMNEGLTLMSTDMPWHCA